MLEQRYQAVVRVVLSIARIKPAWPLAARAQPVGKLPTIGFAGGASASAWSPWTAAFVQRLRERGWIEGRTVAKCHKLIDE